MPKHLTFFSIWLIDLHKIFLKLPQIKRFFDRESKIVKLGLMEYLLRHRTLAKLTIFDILIRPLTGKNLKEKFPLFYYFAFVFVFE